MSVVGETGLEPEALSGSADLDDQLAAHATFLPSLRGP